jgi:hypothetical protein
MALVITRVQFQTFLNAWEDYLRNCWLHLYRYDREPLETDTVEDYEAMEAFYSGYAPVPLTDWKPAFLNQELQGEKAHEYVLFTYGQPGVNCEVYGYYITDYFGYLVGAERDPRGPTMMDHPGQVYDVKPRLTLRNEPVPEEQKRKM